MSMLTISLLKSTISFHLADFLQMILKTDSIRKINTLIDTIATSLYKPLSTLVDSLTNASNNKIEDLVHEVNRLTRIINKQTIYINSLSTDMPRNRSNTSRTVHPQTDQREHQHIDIIVLNNNSNIHIDTSDIGPTSLHNEEIKLESTSRSTHTNPIQHPRIVQPDRYASLADIHSDHSNTNRWKLQKKGGNSSLETTKKKIEKQANNSKQEQASTRYGHMRILWRKQSTNNMIYNNSNEDGSMTHRMVKSHRLYNSQQLNDSGDLRGRKKGCGTCGECKDILCVEGQRAVKEEESGGKRSVEREREGVDKREGRLQKRNKFGFRSNIGRIKVIIDISSNEDEEKLKVRDVGYRYKYSLNDKDVHIGSGKVESQWIMDRLRYNFERQKG